MTYDRFYFLNVANKIVVDVECDTDEQAFAAIRKQTLHVNQISKGRNPMRPTRRGIMWAAVATGSMTLFGTRQVFAVSEAAEIDQNAHAALNRLYATDHRAAELGRKAAGVLVFPKIVKAGFIFGGQGGKGVLKTKGQTQRYYTIAAASFGLQAGVQWFSSALFFKDEAALKYLDKSDGWSLGADPNVVVLDKGAGAQMDSTTLAKEVIAIPFGQEGLMAGLSLQGSKITTYDPAS
jgi:lipid-binding SYLF domain-containing protein